MPQVRSDTDDGRFVWDMSIPVRRVGLVDLNDGEWHQWLLGRLGERWPHIGGHNFRGHLVAWMNSNEHLLIRAGRGVAMAAKWPEPLSVNSIVREAFLFMEDKMHPTWRNEAVRLYREMQIWAATIGASRVDIGYCTDITLGRLAEMVGAEQAVRYTIEARRANARAATAA